MTVVAVLADPPRPGLLLPRLATTSPLSEAEAASLAAAMLKDTLRAVEASGGDLLVNYRPDDLLPDRHVRPDESAEAAVRSLADDALDDPEAARFEVQVGSTRSARAGNTVTHLLETEGVQSAAVVRGDTPLLRRSTIDSAAMNLRTNEVVLGPSTDGRVYYAGFTAPIDFEGAFVEPTLETLVDGANDAGHDTEFLAMFPTIRTGADLATLVSSVRARWQAGRVVPEHTATFVVEHGLTVANDDEDGTPTLVRD
ncbi:hypothetical protein GCM10008995_04750 [Halobellus salinus]|uniref:DUF2064 domain-containing protein n=1 Tax=Halobellus salinus TaxID=931585 RepID=A0A830EJP7_9EURY|nr:DUF2064 domain-containing protein [Halobellus salinus]GGI97901.1 hypothetical protein GCM10008995_04750 [Halobellus salinus]SMP06800.1 hypothetical protein SAMN06265347_102203 [Halobellus salinus]